MKRTIVSMVALAVMAGGILAASAAAAPEVLTAYNLDATFTNLTVDVWSVDGAPFTTNAIPSAGTPEFFPSGTTVTTDGSGNITGAGLMAMLNNTNGTPLSAFVVSITGKIKSTVAGSPTVSMTVKGNGYTVNSNGIATAASILVKFNSSGIGDSAQSRIPGVLGGLIKGITPGNAKSQVIIAQTAFVEASDDLPFHANPPLVVQSSKGKVVILGGSLMGTGTVRGSNYVFSAKGTGLNSASSVTMAGVEGSYTNTAFGSTNEIVFSAPKTAAITKGKIKGQKIFSEAASSVTANLITGD